MVIIRGIQMTSIMSIAKAWQCCCNELNFPLNPGPLGFGMGPQIMLF